MSAATRDEIVEWTQEGRRQKAAYLIVVCDTFDHDDYPVYVKPGESLAEKRAKYDGPNMQRVHEVIDLQTKKK